MSIWQKLFGVWKRQKDVSISKTSYLNNEQAQSESIHIKDRSSREVIGTDPKQHEIIKPILTEQIEIGNQVWMCRNLNVDHYRNGDPIPEVTDPKIWRSLNKGAWCYYDNNPIIGRKYGRLYNWYAVSDPRRLAPEGWHVAKRKEFEMLSELVNHDGDALKAIGQGTGTNTSKYSALLSGSRNKFGYFEGLGGEACFWSATEGDAWGSRLMLIYGGNRRIDTNNYTLKILGFSIRCLKD